MSPKTFRPYLLSMVLGAAVLACGKSEPAPVEASTDKPADEGTEPASKDEPDAASEEQDADAAAKDDAVDLAKGRRAARDRLNRRPPPHGRDLPAPGAEEGATPDGRDPKAMPDPASPGLPAPIDAPAPPEGVPANGPGSLPPEPSSAPSPHPELAAPPDPSQPEAKHGALPGDLHKAPPPPNPQIAQGPALDATTLLPLASVLEVTQAKGLTDAGVLPGIATGPGYVSILYKGAAADKFGVSLQAWQDPGRREADDRFRRMRLQYPNAEDVQVLQPAKSFFSHFNGIQMLTFVDSVKRVVATVACAESVCTHEQLTRLAKSVRERL